MLGLTFIPQMIRITPQNLKCLTAEGKRRLDMTQALKGDICTLSSPNGLGSDPDPESEKQLVDSLAGQLGLSDLTTKIFPPSRKKILLGVGIIITTFS